MWGIAKDPAFTTFKTDHYEYGGTGGCCWNSRGVETAFYIDQLGVKMLFDKQHHTFQWVAQEWISWKCNTKYEYIFRATLDCKIYLYSKIQILWELLLTSFHHVIKTWKSKFLWSLVIFILKNKSDLFIYLKFHWILFS